MKRNEKDILELKDLAVSSYLYALKQVDLIGTKRLSTGEVFFQFAPKEQAENLISLYWNLKAPLIQPKELFNAQRNLKDLIFRS